MGRPERHVIVAIVVAALDVAAVEVVVDFLAVVVEVDVVAAATAVVVDADVVDVVVAIVVVVDVVYCCPFASQPTSVFNKNPPSLKNNRFLNRQRHPDKKTGVANFCPTGKFPNYQISDLNN